MVIHAFNIKPGSGRSALMQGAYQMAGLATTLAIAVVGGLITGKAKCMNASYFANHLLFSN